VEVNGAIWQETTRADGSAMREQLSGLANNEISIRQSQAANGRTFTTTTTVDRADAKVTTASADSAMTNTAAAISRGGLVVSATSSGYSGATVTHYDALGRVLNVQDAGIGTTTDITYDPATGALATVQTSGTGLSTSASNSYYTASEASPGRLKSRTVDGVTTYYSYSSRGELTAQWGATYPVKYEYDSAGRLWKLHTYHTEPGTSPSAWPAGDVTEWIYYQGSTLLQQKKDFANQAAAYEYNNAGRLSKRTWARDVQTTYFYNQAGEMRLTQYNDGLTANVSVTRDNRGRIATINDGTGLRTLRYAASGEVEAEESASGRRLQWSYDVGRKSGYALWDQGQWQTWGGWGYDGATGHMSGVSVPAFGGSPPANWIGYHYSGGQVLPDTTTLGSIVTTRTPDGLGRLQNIRTTVNGTVPGPGLRHGYHYDAAGRHDVVTREDQSTWNYAYNGRSEVTDGIKKWTGGTAVAGEQYGYAFDAIGNRTSETLNARGTTWTYTTLNNALRATHTVPPASDALDVLGEADAAATVRVNSVNATRQGTHFHRAVAGPPRLLTQPRWLTVDVEEDKGAGGLTHANGQMFVRPRGEVMAYDVDGNLISDGHWSYTWDGENRLIEMKSLWDTNTWSKRERLVFRYDSQSRRTQKEYYTRTSSTATWDFQRRNHYIYDGWNLIAEYSETPNTQPGTLNLLHTYHWGLDLSGSLQNAGGVGGLLLMVDRSTPASQTCFYCYDGNGNVVGLLNVTDPANPAIGAEYEYGAFGEPLRETGAIAASNPFRFSTKYHDTETGLAYYGYRYYQPLTGRWISRDPIQERGGANLYAQSLNDGVNRFDPDGEESVNAQIMKTDGVIVIVSGPEDNTSQNNPVKPSGGVVYVPILDQAHINFETVQQKKRDAIKEYEEKEKKRCCKHIHLDTHYSSTAADAKSYLQREAHFHFLAAHGLKGGAPPDLTGLLFSTGAPDKNNKYWGKAYPISDAVPGNVNSGEINVHACYDAGLPNSVGGVRVVKISNTWDENNKNKFYTAFKKAVTSLCSCNPQ
jgi:RHS repeat-associated protein